MHGLSVVICCHNGSTRLPATLKHLKTQKSSSVPWELLVIDNASSDDTAEVAESLWQNGPVPLRVISEPRLGVRYARERGLREAKFEFLGFVDDDNWLAPDWVRTAHQIISSDKHLGAVGSIRKPAFEVPPPSWFQSFHFLYAILTEQEFSQLHEPLELPTAGLCVRKIAWTRLVQNGFHFQLTGTMGKKLEGGEDAELTMALRLSGWKLLIDPRLRLEHFMPRHRLQWSYLRILIRNYSASRVILDAYTAHSFSVASGARRRISESWLYQLGKALGRIASQPGAVIASVSSVGEGRNDIAEVEQQFGRVIGLLRLRGRYGAVRRELKLAPWRYTNRTRDELGHGLHNILSKT